MIEFVKDFLMLFGLIAIIYTSGLFTIDCRRKFKRWRRNDCKIKCLCKHEYDVEGAIPFDGRINLRCKKCGKIKKVKNLSYETTTEIQRCLKNEE